MTIVTSNKRRGSVSERQDKRISVAVSESFRRRLKTATAARGTTIATVVRQLLEKWLAENEPPNLREPNLREREIR